VGATEQALVALDVAVKVAVDVTRAVEVFFARRHKVAEPVAGLEGGLPEGQRAPCKQRQPVDGRQRQDVSAGVAAGAAPG